jgi:archaellum component FlaC
MSKVNIQPHELASMISRLQQFSAQMNAISIGMQSYANSLGASWQDPQYQQFQISIQGTAKQLKGSKDQMEAMSKQLRVLKQNVEKAQQDFKRMQR